MGFYVAQNFPDPTCRDRSEFHVFLRSYWPWMLGTGVGGCCVSALCECLGCCKQQEAPNLGEAEDSISEATCHDQVTVRAEDYLDDDGDVRRRRRLLRKEE